MANRHRLVSVRSTASRIFEVLCESSLCVCPTVCNCNQTDMRRNDARMSLKSSSCSEFMFSLQVFAKWQHQQLSTMTPDWVTSSLQDSMAMWFSLVTPTTSVCNAQRIFASNVYTCLGVRINGGRPGAAGAPAAFRRYCCASRSCVILSSFGTECSNASA